jgi:hypothetical protein
MAHCLVALIERVMLIIVMWWMNRDIQLAQPGSDFALSAIRLVLIDSYPYRNAGSTAFAIRTVSEYARTAKALLHQVCVYVRIH